jgi:hypothetical protein
MNISGRINRRLYNETKNEKNNKKQKTKKKQCRAVLKCQWLVDRCDLIAKSFINKWRGDLLRILTTVITCHVKKSEEKNILANTGSKIFERNTNT